MSVFGTLGLYYRKGNGRIAIVPVPITLGQSGDGILQGIVVNAVPITFIGGLYPPEVEGFVTNSVPITISLGNSEVMQGMGVTTAVPITIGLGNSEVMQGMGVTNAVPINIST